MPPTVLDGDSGEFQYMAYILGVPHSTGYPLYILLGKLFTFLPFGDVAFRVNLMSVVYAALALPFIYATALRLSRRRIPAILATTILAVTPSVWGGALETKEYSLHLLLGVLCVWFALRWYEEGQPRDFYLFALMFGLGLTNHLIIAFTAPALALVIWFNRARLNRALMVRGVLLALLPLLLYAYIPIRANYWIAQQDPANWALYTREDAILKGTVTAYYNNNLRGFIDLVTGLGNSYKIKSPLDDNRITLVTTLLLQQYGIVGIALAALGAFESFRRDRKWFSVVFLLALGVGAIATILRGISAVYYFSLAYFALALWIGFGIDALMRASARLHRAAPVLVAVGLLVLPISSLLANYAPLDESDNYDSRDYAQAALSDHLAKNAVVIAPWEVSQPMRYFQFVDNQRTDLLVVNVSQTMKQFYTMLQNAHALKRPFYSVEFTPELKTPGTPRSVQAIPLPLMEEPQPHYRLQETRIVDEVRVLGYDLEPDLPQPGKPVRVLVYYQALARMYPMYSSTLTVTDIQGRLWGEYNGFPGSFYFPTYRWYQVGEFYRDGWTINLPADAPSGLYNLDLSWYVYDLATGKSDLDHEHKVSLGTIRVGDISGDAIAHAQNIRVGGAITFLGWNSQPPASGESLSSARGQSINLDLFWRADRAIQDSYTVFVHLTDATGHVIMDADSPPSQGVYPTDRWSAGETVRDRHALKIPADLAPGNYFIEVGMYLPSTGARLPIGSTDKIALTQVSTR